MSGKITNERHDDFFAGPEYEAKDEHGHKGYGRTAEEAQIALEMAQKHNVEKCVNKALLVLGNPIESPENDSDSNEDKDTSSENEYEASETTEDDASDEYDDEEDDFDDDEYDEDDDDE